MRGGGGWDNPPDRPYRNDALALAAALVPALGQRWLLKGSPADGTRLAALLLNLACIEIRLSVEERPSPERDNKAEAVVPAACTLVETYLQFLASDDDATPSNGARLADVPAEMLLRWQQVLQTTIVAVVDYLADWQVRPCGPPPPPPRDRLPLDNGHSADRQHGDGG